jgi:hypothetical protein
VTEGDNLHKALLRTGQGQVGKIFRRKRRRQGEVFSGQKPPTMQEVNKGVWCRRCHLRHPYNGSDRVRLGSAYEKRGNTFVLMWLCPNSGDVVGELWLWSNHEQTTNEETVGSDDEQTD